MTGLSPCPRRDRSGGMLGLPAVWWESRDGGEWHRQHRGHGQRLSGLWVFVGASSALLSHPGVFNPGVSCLLRGTEDVKKTVKDSTAVHVNHGSSQIKLWNLERFPHCSCKRIHCLCSDTADDNTLTLQTLLIMVSPPTPYIYTPASLYISH